MKKFILPLTLVLSIVTCNLAQAQNARELSVKLDKNKENAIVAEYDQPEEVMETVLKKQLEQEGLDKSKKHKGFSRYAETTWKRISPQSADYYFKVDGKKDHATITVLISKGYNNFISSGSDREAVEQMKAFLNNLAAAAEAYSHALKVKAQEDVVTKAEKAFNESEENNKDLLSQKEKLEKKIAENNNEQALRQKALDDEKKKLEALRTVIN